MLVSHLRLNSVLTQIKQLSLWLTLLVSLVGCRSPLIAIEEVSPKKVGKTVYLAGRVVGVAPFLDNAAYQIADDTGKIWVVTTQTLPQSNQEIKIKGKVEYQSLPFAEQELGDFYLIELEQLPALAQ